ncbi:MAG: TIGR03960 family B12-binding radical SAM protein [Desulfobacteraceae bacterium]
MPVKSIKDLLPYVQNPSRYLGTEVNRVVKSADTVKLKTALAFPDLYDIGTSHFGIQILYHLLNRHDDILAERIFAPATDMEALMRKHGIALASLESTRPMAEFDLVGFSLLYELNYTNVLNMLELGKIPLRWEERDARHPFIVAGGPSVCNPEPMADFFDAMVFGDGETVVLEMAGAWVRWKEAGGQEKAGLLEAWSGLEGVYIPRFFKPSYDAYGFQQLTPAVQDRPSIRRAIVSDLDGARFPDHPIIPFGKPIHDRLRLEVARGCTRGCRYCQAGMIYRPVRERSPQRIMALIKEALEHTGYEDLSLLSLSTGDYTCLTPLMEQLMQLCSAEQVAVSLPSLRAGTLSPRLMALIRRVRKTGFTIAPEAGSQRLRDVINKNITFEDVKTTVENAFELGWNVIKLYFMIGLPTETDKDLDAIVDMVQQLKRIPGPRRRKSKINVSITTFVPKPHTPFQWASQISLEESRRRIRYLKQHLQLPGVQIKWQKPEMSILEGLLARGDRRLGMLIQRAVQSGSKFDGWNDQFEFNRWKAAIAQCDLDPDFFTIRSRDLDEPLPWQHMDARVDVSFLKAQWQAARDSESVKDCRYGECHGCGVCDFDTVAPCIFETDAAQTPGTVDDERADADHYIWLSLTYTKLGDARFFGHLELSHIFSRAIRRAHIQVQFSKGFHPMPKLSFDDPLPLGIESQAEEMRMLVASRHGCTEVAEALNLQLPDGVRIIDCRLRSQVKKLKSGIGQRFSIQLTGQRFDPGALSQFNSSETWHYVRTNRKGSEHRIDLKRCLDQIMLDASGTLVYDISSVSPFTIRPADVLKGLFKLPVDLLQEAKVMKLDLMKDKRAVDIYLPRL